MNTQVIENSDANGKNNVRKIRIIHTSSNVCTYVYVFAVHSLVGVPSRGRGTGTMHTHTYVHTHIYSSMYIRTLRTQEQYAWMHGYDKYAPFYMYVSCVLALPQYNSQIIGLVGTTYVYVHMYIHSCLHIREKVCTV